MANVTMRKLIKSFLSSIILFLCMPATGLAQENEKNGEFYYGFLNGTYEAIGRYPDSKETYTGKVIFRKSHDTLRVIRIINNNATKGMGKIDIATADKIKVLRVTFTENKREYEATYLIDTDLDNYGRLTGHIYLKAGGTKKPGLEALFSDHVYKK